MTENDIKYDDLVRFQEAMNRRTLPVKENLENLEARVREAILAYPEPVSKLAELSSVTKMTIYSFLNGKSGLACMKFGVAIRLIRALNLEVML